MGNIQVLLVSNFSMKLFSNLVALGVLKHKNMAHLAYKSIIDKIIIIQIIVLSNNIQKLTCDTHLTNTSTKLL